MRLRQLIIVFTMLICYLYPSDVHAGAVYFREGDQGQEIIAIKSKLNEVGFRVNTKDGSFDSKTVIAVKKFQKAKKLKADGVIDDITYRTLMGRDLQASGQKNTKAWEITNTALAFRGTPYKFGGASPQGFDCSGFLMYVYNKHGIKLPRTADEQFKVGKTILKKDLKRGDLVFFTTYASGASHCGIYLESGQFIHASSSKGIMVSNINEKYWGTRFFGAKRVLL